MTYGLELSHGQTSQSVAAQGSDRLAKRRVLEVSELYQNGQIIEVRLCLGSNKTPASG
jgi:hypothetical protein